jgi:hypothetical protein
MNEDLLHRLRERARIRRQIPGRKSVENNEPDRIADLLDEAAQELVDCEMVITNYRRKVRDYHMTIDKILQVVDSIANDRIELSHDKIKWQAEAHVMWCQQLRKELYER